MCVLKHESCMLDTIAMQYQCSEWPFIKRGVNLMHFNINHHQFALLIYLII